MNQTNSDPAPVAGSEWPLEEASLRDSEMCPSTSWWCACLLFLATASVPAFLSWPDPVPAHLCINICSGGFNLKLDRFTQKD